MHVQVDAVILSVTAIVAVLLWQTFQQRMFLEVLKLVVHAADRATAHYLDYHFARSPRAAGTWPPPLQKDPPDPPVQGRVADPPPAAPARDQPAASTRP